MSRGSYLELYESLAKLLEEILSKFGKKARDMQVDLDYN